MRSTRTNLSLMFALTCGACGPTMNTGDAGGDVHIPHAAVPDDMEPMCTGPGTTPLRTGTDTMIECATLGATTAAPTSDWAASIPAGALYVQPGATGGDGTQAHPFASIADALAASPTAPIALSRGMHTLTTTIALSAARRFIGAGAGGTTIASTAAPLFSVAMGGDLALSGVALTTDTSCASGSEGISLTMGATATISDVSIRGFAIGIHATGATVHGNGISITDSCTHAIDASASSDLQIQSLSVRTNAAGVIVTASHLDLQRADLGQNHGTGLEIVGGSGSALDRVDQVSMQCDAFAGMIVSGTVTVQATRVLSSGTTVDTSGHGGDGLRVIGGAHVDLDSMLSSDADRDHGSAFIANARAGILASGTGTTLRLHGALVSTNLGTGLFVQDNASAVSVSFSLFRANSAAGIAVTSGATVGSFQCDAFDGTRSASITTDTGTVTAGDALSAANTTGSAMITGTSFTRNDGFAAVFHASTATLTTNTGTCNGHGVGSYSGAMVTVDATNSIDANAALPDTAPPHIQGMLAL